MIDVSVPFPGILFLNLGKKVYMDKYTKVSVPFPGILFLNYLAEGYECESGAVGFRPLPGDLISQ